MTYCQITSLPFFKLLPLHFCHMPVNANPGYSPESYPYLPLSILPLLPLPPPSPFQPFYPYFPYSPFCPPTPIFLPPFSLPTTISHLSILALLLLSSPSPF